MPYHSEFYFILYIQIVYVRKELSVIVPGMFDNNGANDFNLDILLLPENVICIWTNINVNNTADNIQERYNTAHCITRNPFERLLKSSCIQILLYASYLYWPFMLCR